MPGIKNRFTGSIKKQIFMRKAVKIIKLNTIEVKILNKKQQFSILLKNLLIK